MVRGSKYFTFFWLTLRLGVHGQRIQSNKAYTARFKWRTATHINTVYSLLGEHSSVSSFITSQLWPDIVKI
jgi:hypothetical protein